MNRRSFLGAAAAAGGSVATPKKVAGHHRVGSAQGAETDFRNIEWGPKAKEILRRTGAGAVRALRLSPGPHLFVDWRLVKAGGVHWASRDTGERLPLQVRDSEGRHTEEHIDAGPNNGRPGPGGQDLECGTWSAALKGGSLTSALQEVADDRHQPLG